MPLTLLQLVRRAAGRLGIARPATALTTESATQLVEFASESGEDLLKRHDWEILKTDVTFTGAATQTLATDHDRFLGSGDGELWSVGFRSPCRGPLNSRSWTAVTLSTTGSVPPAWSLRENMINLYPVPDVTDTFTYTYISNLWVTPSGGGTRIAHWENDNDTTIFPDDAMRYGMIWRWRQAKGFDYSEDLSNAERAIERAISRDRGPRVIETARTFNGIPGDPWPDNYFPGTVTP